MVEELVPFFRLESTLTDLRYVDIISDLLHYFIRIQFPDRDRVFQYEM